MLEFVIVGEGKIWPHRCRSCLSYKDLVDTHVEDNDGRLYWCKLCVSRAARVLGLVEGERQEELMAADGRLRQVEGELRDRDKVIEEQRAARAELDAAVVKLESDRDWLSGRVEQLESTIREKAEAELALVGQGTVTFGNQEANGEREARDIVGDPED